MNCGSAVPARLELPGSPVARGIRGAVLIAAGALGLAACGGGAPESGMQMPPVQVSVAGVVSRNILDWDEFTGRIEAVDTVELRPRVAGYLEAVHFREGAVVEQGDLLFTIDPREYQAAVDAARANLERAETRLALAEQELARSERLIAALAVSREELEQRRSELQQATADQSGARAQLAQAELNLSFSRITAPITGRISAAFVKPGNLVSPGETLLTTLVSVDPVYVVFEADENVYLKLQNQLPADFSVGTGGESLTVEVALAGDDGFPYAGELDFLDNRVDPATGTIRGRAVLPNPDGRLTPGLFARVRLFGASEREAFLIHDMAILTDQDRKYVYVVGEDNTAIRRDITIGQLVDGLRVVDSGLTTADQIVVNGVRKIFFPGMALMPEPVSMENPLGGAAGGAGMSGTGEG
jgi:multidrug efflux system membrane fusion protein